MFGAFTSFGKLGAIGKAIAAAWSPLSLWPDGISSAGMWISPRTLDSQWQDYLGTTPVSVPGTVADSSNPVGLALDIRAGDPPPLGPEIWTDPPVPDPVVAVKIADRTYQFTGVTGYFGFWFGIGQTLGRSYKCSVVVTGLSSGALSIGAGGAVLTVTSNGSFSNIQTTTDAASGCNIYANGVSAGATVSVSVKEVPGNHMLQSTSAARPLMSAYDGQTLGPGDTYDATGYPIFQKYDGVDDGMATAAFTAGALINGMDCMIPVRRDSGTIAVIGGWDSTYKWFAAPDSTDSVQVCYGICGTPTVWVNGVQLSGGTSVKRDTLAAALTIGDWHILEFRDLDLSTWTSFKFGNYPGAAVNGARGDIMLYPSTASTEDKDAARQYLADYYGVTLP